MNSLKIPDLNLFRGKRENRENQTARIDKKSFNLLLRGKNKADIEEMQAELYLDNYKANLKHFVSPTKYKDQAEKYLKSSKANDQIYLKSIQFPQSRRFCSNCFDKYVKVNRQCYCEIQPNVPEMYRYKTITNNNAYKIDNFQKKARIESQNKKIQVLTVKQDPSSKRQEQIISHDFILTQSEVPPKQQISFQEQQISHSSHRENKSIIQTINNRVIPDSSYFYDHLKKREDYLQHLEMNIDDSRAIEVDFQGLNQARKQYINKSNQILERLDQIIRSHSP